MQPYKQQVSDKSSAIFVEQFNAPAEAGARWKADVEEGKEIAYLTKDSLLGNTQSGADLDDWLSSADKSAEE